MCGREGMNNCWCTMSLAANAAAGPVVVKDCPSRILVSLKQTPLDPSNMFFEALGLPVHGNAAATVQTWQARLTGFINFLLGIPASLVLWVQAGREERGRTREPQVRGLWLCHRPDPRQMPPSQGFV